MPLKRAGSSTKDESESVASRFKHLKNGSRDEDKVTKDEMVEAGLIAFRMVDYDPDVATKHGSSHRVEADLVFIESEELHSGQFIFGNLAEQIGRDLEPKEIGLGRVVKGNNPNTGRDYYGIEWSEDEAEYTVAEKVLVKIEAGF